MFACLAYYRASVLLGAGVSTSYVWLLPPVLACAAAGLLWAQRLLARDDKTPPNIVLVILVGLALGAGMLAIIAYVNFVHVN